MQRNCQSMDESDIPQRGEEGGPRRAFPGPEARRRDAVALPAAAERPALGSQEAPLGERRRVGRRWTLNRGSGRPQVRARRRS